MNTLIPDFIRYFDGAIGISPILAQWHGAVGLPFFLRAGKEYREGAIAGKEVIFVFLEGQAGASDIKEFDFQLGRKTDQIRVFVSQKMDAYTRSALVKLKIPFVVPGKQMYLPNFFIDLRESYSHHFDAVSSAISPSAQVIAIRMISSRKDESFSSVELANWLGVTRMTISKACNELARFESFRIRDNRKVNHLLIEGSRREAWNQVKYSMRSPVKKVGYFHGISEYWNDSWMRAGETALSDLTLLGEPHEITLACSKEKWKGMEDSLSDKGKNSYHEYGAFQAMRNPDQFKSLGMPYVRLEQWMYDPRLLSEGHQVDPISLYLSLADEGDERVQSCLTELMENQEWYMD